MLDAHVLVAAETRRDPPGDPGLGRRAERLVEHVIATCAHVAVSTTLWRHFAQHARLGGPPRLIVVQKTRLHAELNAKTKLVFRDPKPLEAHERDALTTKGGGRRRRLKGHRNIDDDVYLFELARGAAASLVVTDDAAVLDRRIAIETALGIATMSSAEVLGSEEAR